MTAKRFLVWGASGHGKVVADLIERLGFEFVGFVDANPSVRPTVSGRAVDVIDEGSLLEELAAGSLPRGADAVAFGLGDNAARSRWAGILGGFCAPPLIHPGAHVSRSARVANGTVVFAGAVINADAVIGAASIINSAAVVEHDCRLGDAVHVSPGAVLAGNVSVGGRTWVGANATVIQGRTLGQNVIVGAGSVVIRDVPDSVTVAGVPARVIRGA